MGSKGRAPWALGYAEICKTRQTFMDRECSVAKVLNVSKILKRSWG